MLRGVQNEPELQQKIKENIERFILEQYPLHYILVYEHLFYFLKYLLFCGQGHKDFLIYQWILKFGIGKQSTPIPLFIQSNRKESRLKQNDYINKTRSKLHMPGNDKKL